MYLSVYGVERRLLGLRGKHKHRRYTYPFILTSILAITPYLYPYRLLADQEIYHLSRQSKCVPLPKLQAQQPRTLDRWASVELYRLTGRVRRWIGFYGRYGDLYL